MTSPVPDERRATPPLATAIPVLVVLTALLAALTGVALTWPRGDSSAGQAVDSGVERVHARVVATSSGSCEGTIEDVEPDGTVPETVDCLTVTARPDGSDSTVDVVATSGLTAADLPAGTAVILERYPASDGADEVWAWGDFARGVPLLAFALAFALVTVLVAGLRGLRALLGLGVAFAVVAGYLLPALVAGAAPLVVTLSAGIVVVVAVVYLSHGPGLRSTVALVGTILGLLVVTGLGVLGAHLAHLQPIASEDDLQLARLLGDQGVQVLRGAFLAGVTLAGIGVLNDVTITQASAIWELHDADPSADARTLMTRGMRVGRDHIASTVYTIAFAYAGASMPVLLLLQVYQQPLSWTLTGNAFGQEIVRTLAGSIGLVLAIPLTTVVAALAVRGTASPSPAESPRPGRHSA